MSEVRAGLKSVAVIADSFLGRELAATLAASGGDVRLFGLDQRDGAAGNARSVAGLADAVAGAELLVDATTWPLERKREVITQLDELAPEVPIAAIALTASTTEIGSWSLTPERICGFGYLPPLGDAKILEIAPGLRTCDAARQTTERLVAALDREAAVVADGAGLVGPRIVSLIINEAAYALMEGVASAQDIDAGVRLGANYPHGPLEWADQIGIDLVYAIIKAMQDEFGEDRYRPAPLLRKMVLAGWTGRAAGRGFYTY